MVGGRWFTGGSGRMRSRRSRRALRSFLIIAVSGFLLRRMFTTVRVQGHSMSPTLTDGAVVVARRSSRRIRIGRIIVFTNPVSPYEPAFLVKRVIAIRRAEGGGSEYFVDGDAVRSSSSINFGWIGREQVSSRVVCPNSR